MLSISPFYSFFSYHLMSNKQANLVVCTILYTNRTKHQDFTPCLLLIDSNLEFKPGYHFINLLSTAKTSSIPREKWWPYIHQWASKWKSKHILFSSTFRKKDEKGQIQGVKPELFSKVLCFLVCFFFSSCLFPIFSSI